MEKSNREELDSNIKTIQDELSCLELKVNVIEKGEYLKRLKIIGQSVDNIKNLEIE